MVVRKIIGRYMLHSKAKEEASDLRLPQSRQRHQGRIVRSKPQGFREGLGNPKRRGGLHQITAAIRGEHPHQG